MREGVGGWLYGCVLHPTVSIVFYLVVMMMVVVVMVVVVSRRGSCMMMIAPFGATTVVGVFVA